jgi:hypothetical protein
VTAAGQPPAVIPSAPIQDPIALLNALVQIMGQQYELVRQMHEMQRQQLELVRETTQLAREQRARQAADLERWQAGHESVLDDCKQTLARLEGVHANLMRELTEYVEENHENLAEGDFTLSDFVDRFGPRLAHLNTILAILRPLAAASKKSDGS